MGYFSSFSLPLFILFNKVNVGVFCSLILIDFLNWDPLEIINQQKDCGEGKVEKLY